MSTHSILSIGITNFSGKNSLPNAFEDAKIIGKLFGDGNPLTKSLNADCSCILGPVIEKHDAIAKIIEFSERSSLSQTAILYFASHGVYCGNQFFFYCTDTKSKYLYSTGLGINEIVQILNKRTDRDFIIIADTCREVQDESFKPYSQQKLNSTLIFPSQFGEKRLDSFNSTDRFPYLLANILNKQQGEQSVKNLIQSMSEYQNEIQLDTFSNISFIGDGSFIIKCPNIEDIDHILHVNDKNCFLLTSPMTLKEAKNKSNEILTRQGSFKPIKISTVNECLSLEKLFNRKDNLVGWKSDENNDNMAQVFIRLGNRDEKVLSYWLQLVLSELTDFFYEILITINSDESTIINLLRRSSINVFPTPGINSIYSWIHNNSYGTIKLSNSTIKFNLNSQEKTAPAIPLSESTEDIVILSNICWRL